MQTESIQQQQERLMTLKEVAKRTSLSEPTITRMLKSGKLRGGKVGKVWRIRESQFNRWMDATFGK
jgi:excisionase family DNA binding protein